MKNYDVVKFAEAKSELLRASDLCACALRNYKESLRGADHDDLEESIAIMACEEMMELENRINKIEKMLVTLEA